MNLFRSPTIVIRRIGNDVEVIVQSWGLDTNEKKTVRGSEAAMVVSSVFATHADRWVDLFAPEYAVSDGYLWTMTVYSGSRFFACEGGGNVTPVELVDLLYAVADVGLPLAWDGGAILLPDESKSDDIQ